MVRSFSGLIYLTVSNRVPAADAKFAQVNRLFIANMPSYIS